MLAGAAFVMSATPGFADGSLKDAPATGDKLEWSGYVQGTNDYVFRGISQYRREPTLQGGLDVSYGMFYVGTFVSGVDFRDKNLSALFNLDSKIEVDLYGGIKPKWGDVTFDFGVIAYTYPNSKVSHPFTYDPTYVEFKAGASTTVWKDVALSGTIFVSPDFNGEVGKAVDIEGSISKPIYKYSDFDFAASATLGHQFFDKSVTPTFTPLTDYTYWNVGLTTTFKTNWSLDLRYWDTDLDSGKAPCGAADPTVSVFQCGSSFSATAKVGF